MRRATVIKRWAAPVAFIAALLLAPSTASGSGLGVARFVVAFSGTMTTTWAQAPNATYSPDRYCWDATESGQGKQTVTYRTTGTPELLGVAGVRGRDLALQVPPSQRARPGVAAPGFGLARLNRTGSLLTTYSAAKNTPGEGCAPPPPPYRQEESGCGTYRLPWDLQVQFRRGVLALSVNATTDQRRGGPCPFEDVNREGQRGSQGSFPATTQETVGDPRRLFRRVGSKLVVRGSQTWTSRQGVGGTLTAKTTVSWTLTVRRTR